MAIFLALLIGLIIFGGIKWIANAATAVVPFMAIAYILMAVIIIFINIEQVPALFALIFKSAFGFEAAFGGIVGAMIEIGVKKVYIQMKQDKVQVHMLRQQQKYLIQLNKGLVQSFSVYIDTLFVCTATALIILLSGTYNVTDGGSMSDGKASMIKDNGIFVEMSNGDKDYSGTAMYAQAGIDKAFQGSGYHFDPTFSGFGSYFIAIALFFFAFTTILAYYYIAETNITYLTRRSSKRTTFIYINFMNRSDFSYSIWCS